MEAVSIVERSVALDAVRYEVSSRDLVVMVTVLDARAATSPTMAAEL